MSFSALLTMSARIELIVFWMVFLFFPAMTLHAPIFILASIFVTTNEWPRSPIGALVFGVLVKLGLSSEVLPVMCINTYVTLMLTFVIGTPYRFEMEHIEIYILLKLIYELHWDFSFWMGKWTVFSILTFTCAINIWWAKLGFILIRMVEFFNSIMSLLACVTIRTILTFSSKLTHFRLVYAERSPLIFLLIVIVRTSFQVMAIGIYLARLDFKHCQIKKTAKLFFLLLGSYFKWIHIWST